MIQEIYPDFLDNALPKKAPQRNDIAVIYQNGRFLLKQEKDALRFLRLEEIGKEEQVISGAIPLFTLADKTWYLIEKFSEEAKSDLLWQSEQIFRSKQLSKTESFGGLTALHLIHWHHSSEFCGVCGTRTVWDRAIRKKNCPKCGNEIFPRLNPAVIVAVVDHDRLLMSKYSGKKDGRYVLLAGFVEIGETLEEACAREVYEETGVHIKNIRYYRSQPWGYSDSILSGFFAELDGEKTLHVDLNELSEARWMKSDEIEAVDEDFSLTNVMIMEFKRGRW